MPLRAWQLHAVGRALTNYYCETWSHGKREGKANSVAAKKQLYEREIPDCLFAEGLEKKRQSKKKKPQRSRYKDEIPDFLFRTCMSKVRNTGILSLYNVSRLTVWYIISNTKIKKRICSSSQWTPLHHNGHVKKPN